MISIRSQRTPAAVRLVLIECSTYRMNNLGDIAMLQTLSRRLLSRYPNAALRVITSDPDGVRAVIPGAQALVVGDRREWSLLRPLSTADNRSSLASLVPLEDAEWRRDPAAMARALESVGRRSAAAARLEWSRAIQASDAVIAMGGGYFSEAFADHAVGVLQTLGEAIRAGKPAAIVGCGFEPVEDPLLRAVAADVLPRLGLIGCREGRTSPAVLQSYGVSADSIHITGDDGLEDAQRERQADLGNSIGVNVRSAAYAGLAVETDQPIIEELRSGLQIASAALGVELVPLPISLYEPCDSDAIGALLPTARCDSINTRDALFASLRRCRVVVTGSYHAAVFALAQGIPVVALARSTHYRLKLAGLLDLFDDGSPLDLDDAGLSERLASAVRNAWEKAPSQRSARRKRARNLIEAASRAYELLFEKIEDGPAEPGSEADSPDAGSWPAWTEVLVSIHRHLDTLSASLRDTNEHAEARLQGVITLTRVADERLESARALQATADERLEMIRTLTAAAEERLKGIHALSAIAEERLDMINALKVTAEERLTLIQELDAALRAARRS